MLLEKKRGHILLLTTEIYSDGSDSDDSDDSDEKLRWQKINV